MDRDRSLKRRNMGFWGDNLLDGVMSLLGGEACLI
jgi:hypothetical protein